MERDTEKLKYVEEPTKYLLQRPLKHHLSVKLYYNALGLIHQQLCGLFVFIPQENFAGKKLA